jgi:hypothetical protein
LAAQSPIRQHHQNLEGHRIVTLLPDREPATAQAWLAAHPTITIIASGPW